MDVPPLANRIRQAFLVIRYQQTISCHTMDAGDNREVLEREISVIKELLEEQPDSKCVIQTIEFEAI